jgi:hypothetical protein
MLQLFLNATLLLPKIAFVTSSNRVSTLFPVLEEVSAQRAPIFIAFVFALSCVV